MPEPTIQFNILLGSDTEASGAGPAAAQFGTMAQNRVTAGGTRVGFFDTATPDFSEVDTTGLHALWLQQGSGRRWSKITAKKSTRQNTTGNTTSGSAVVSSSTMSTAGMAANDVIRVVGAGAGGVDLYSEIFTVDSGTQLTLKDNAGTSTTGAAVRDPEQVTIADSLVVNSSVLWAIGGTRKDLQNATQLPADLKPGSIVDIFGVEDLFYTVTTVMNFSVAGDTTTGRIKIRGSGPVKPLIKGNTTNDIFKLSNAYQNVSGLSFAKCLSGVVIDTANATDIVVDTCDFNTTGEALTYGVNIISTVTGRVHLHTLSIRDASQDAILCAGSPAILLIENCHLTHVTSTAHFGIDVTGAPNLLVRFCAFHNFASCIKLGTSTTAAFTLIENNVFEEGARGIDNLTSVNRLRNAVIRNNIFYDENPDISSVAGTDHAVSMADYNAFFSLAERTNISAGPNDIVADPDFRGRITNETGRDWRVGVSMKAKGWPRTFPFGALPQPIDIGALQRSEAIGGNLRIKITFVDDTGDNWSVGFLLLVPGSDLGAGGSILIPKADIPAVGEVHIPAIVAGFLAYLRTGVATAAIGEEMLC